MDKRNIHRALSVTIAAAALFTVQPAMADSLTFNGLFYSGADTVHIKDTATSNAYGSITSFSDLWVYSGGFKMTDASGGTLPAGNSFMAWCIDIHDDMNLGTTSYTLTKDNNYTPSAHVPLGANQILGLERLASNDLSKVTNAKTSSAFQLAAWEIMAETTSPTYSLTTGNFQASNSVLGAIGDASTANTAENWLSNLGNAAPTMELSIWRANSQGTTQDLAVFAPIPEPETYAMMLAGLGLMGFMARRRIGRRDAA